MRESLFIWSNETKKCWFGELTEVNEGEEESIVKVKVTRGKMENGTLHEMFMTREHSLQTDSIGYYPS